MQYFMVEGHLEWSEKITQELLKEHMAYAQKAMDRGMMLLSGLKDSNDGGVFIMKAEGRAQLDEYLNNEPFCRQGFQTYTVKPFSPHYVNPQAKDWFCQ